MHDEEAGGPTFEEAFPIPAGAPVEPSDTNDNDFLVVEKAKEGAETDQPEPAAVRRHPAMAPGEEPFPLADAGEYYIGLWSGKPNYGCPYCPFATLEGNAAVERHILAMVRFGQGSPSGVKHLKALENKIKEVDA